MHLFINELSFVGQARSPYEADQLLLCLAETLQALEPRRKRHNQSTTDADSIYKHSATGDRQVAPDLLVRDWIFKERHDEDRERVRRLRMAKQFLKTRLTAKPHTDTLLAAIDHECHRVDVIEGTNVSGYSVAGAACFSGILISIAGATEYGDGDIHVHYVDVENDPEERVVEHYVTVVEVYRRWRRYVPNPKHHPTVAGGGIAAMELDREYDPFTDQRQSGLRDKTKAPQETAAQRLLDGACTVNGKKQLYAVIYDRMLKRGVYYEFQPDAMGGYHGYPVPEQQVPPAALRHLRKQKDS
jgi:hypothetical protein